MQARSKNTFIVFKYILIFSFFAHDSQIFFPNPSFARCLTAVIGLMIQSVVIGLLHIHLVNTGSVLLQWCRMILCFREGRFKFYRVCARNKWVGINMLMFHFEVTLKQLKIRFINDLFQWFKVDSFFWKALTLYMVHF